jgi:hypothetical protein
MEKHKEALDKLCRVCGCGLRKSKTQYSASKYTKLLAVVGIHSTTDNPDVHPAIFCHMCYTTPTQTTPVAHAPDWERLEGEGNHPGKAHTQAAHQLTKPSNTFKK